MLEYKCMLRMCTCISLRKPEFSGRLRLSSSFGMFLCVGRVLGRWVLGKTVFWGQVGCLDVLFFFYRKPSLVYIMEICYFGTAMMRLALFEASYLNITSGGIPGFCRCYVACGGIKCHVICFFKKTIPRILLTSVVILTVDQKSVCLTFFLQLSAANCLVRDRCEPFKSSTIIFEFFF